VFRSWLVPLDGRDEGEELDDEAAEDGPTKEDTLPKTLPLEDERVGHKKDRKAEFWIIYVNSSNPDHVKAVFCLECELSGIVKWLQCDRKMGYKHLERHYKWHLKQGKRLEEQARSDSRCFLGFAISAYHRERILDAHATFLYEDLRPISAVEGSGFKKVLKAMNPQFEFFDKETVVCIVNISRE
jgi:hypothetical protein